MTMYLNAFFRIIKVIKQSTGIWDLEVGQLIEVELKLISTIHKNPSGKTSRMPKLWVTFPNGNKIELPYNHVVRMLQNFELERKPEVELVFEGVVDEIIQS